MSGALSLCSNILPSVEKISEILVPLMKLVCGSVASGADISEGWVNGIARWANPALREPDCPFSSSYHQRAQESLALETNS
jgi:hypothetical protein